MDYIPVLWFLFLAPPHIQKPLKKGACSKTFFSFTLLTLFVSIYLYACSAWLPYWKHLFLFFYFFCLFILPFHLTYNSLSMLMLLYILFTVIYADTLLVSSIFIVFYFWWQSPTPTGENLVIDTVTWHSNSFWTISSSSNI